MRSLALLAAAVLSACRAPSAGAPSGHRRINLAGLGAETPLGR